MNYARSFSRLDITEQNRRRNLMVRAAGSVKVEADSAVGRAVKAINDRFISGEIEQVNYIAQLKVAIRGAAPASAGSAL